MSRKKCPKTWRYQAGKRPYTVTVFEREPGGILYASVWDSKARYGKGAQRRVSLGHIDRDQAERYATGQAAKLAEGSEQLRSARVTLGTVLDLYEKKRTPKKAEPTQKADGQRIEFFSRMWGRDKDPLKISTDDWDDWVEARRSGAVDARGRLVPKGRRRPVANRTLEADGRWIHAVLNWAFRYKPKGGAGHLLPECPVRGFMSEEYLPREKNPTNDAGSEERHVAMLERASRVTMEVRWHGKRTEAQSWLPELLAIANGTGRRIGSICALNVEDVGLEPGPSKPFGSITWKADHDKEGYKWTAIPIDSTTRAAVLRALERRTRLGRMGSGPLFPRGTDAERPITADIANRWYRIAESFGTDDLENLEPMPWGRTFHGYRSKFAIETKHLPEKDRAEVGGWKSGETIRRVYDKADAESMLRVVTERGTLREAKGL